MREPDSQMEYEARFAKNQRVDGFGIEGVRVHVPCPFCAAPDWVVHGILEAERAYSRGAACAACGRAARVVFTPIAGGKALTFVQTAGGDPPPWVLIPRESELVT